MKRWYVEISDCGLVLECKSFKRKRSADRWIKFQGFELSWELGFYDRTTVYGERVPVLMHYQSDWVEAPPTDLDDFDF